MKQFLTGNIPENAPENTQSGHDAPHLGGKERNNVCAPRRSTRQLQLGSVTLGSDSPIRVQSMTNVPTTNIPACCAQIEDLVAQGAELVRVSCPDEDSTQALAEIVRQVSVPIIADIHFHYRRAIEAARSGAVCLRINPGNIGSKDRVREVTRAASDHGCAIRIGVNAGSLGRALLEKYGEPCAEAMVESALDQAELLESCGFQQYKISVKASNIGMSCEAYRALAASCDAPLHVGITEAGSARYGVVKSAIGIGMLLAEGIGDTIRVSLSADPVEEVKAGYDILKALGLRQRGVTVISCPSCARQQFDVIATVSALEERLAHITEPITVSIIGCVVNGPGEARSTEIGLTGGGKGVHQLYLNGVESHRFSEPGLVEHLAELVERHLAENRKP